MTTAETDRDAWLAERRKGIGGSDVAAILGLSKWRSALDVYYEKLGLADAQPESDAMRWGTLHEPTIIAEFSRVTGLEVRTGLPIQRHEEFPWMLASLDGLVEDRQAIVEAKTSRTADGWGEVGAAEIPSHYMTQVQHYMAVTGAAMAYVVVLVAGSDFRMYEVERDDELIEKLVEVERQFWHENVLAEVPPEPMNAADAAKLWPRDSGATVEADEAIAADVAYLKTVKAEIKRLEEIEVETSDRVKVAIRDAATLTAGGDPIATYKAQTAKRLDMKALEADHGELVKEYRRESVSRVLRLK
jgi:putative phage-type endonuclease